MIFFSELSNLLSGGSSAAHIIAAFIFLLFGALLNVLYDVQTRNASSVETPVTWDWPFFWKANRWRFGLDLLMAMAVARFLSNFTGFELRMVYYFLIGIGFDGMYVVFKKLHKRITVIFDKYFGAE